MYLHGGIPQSTYCNSGTNYQPIIICSGLIVLNLSFSVLADLCAFD